MTEENKDKNQEMKEILRENVNEYYRNGSNAHKRGEYNSSVTLFFKAISGLCDLFLLDKEGKIPSSHLERFRILESSYPKIYRIIDKDFPFYQSSYYSKLNKETSELLKEDAQRLSKIIGIEM